MSRTAAASSLWSAAVAAAGDPASLGQLLAAVEARLLGLVADTDSARTRMFALRFCSNVTLIVSKKVLCVKYYNP